MTNSEKNVAPILFDDFVMGQPLGSHELVYDEALVQGWRGIFGSEDEDTDAQSEAASAAVLLMMRAYLKVVSPRPPGNIHARQTIVFASLPRAGHRLTVHIDCSAKEIKRGRRYIKLRARGESQDLAPVFQGELTLIWAA